MLLVIWLILITAALLCKGQPVQAQPAAQDRSSARAILEEAVAIAERAEGQVRDEALMEAAAAMATLDVDEALLLVERIELNVFKGYALNAMAMALTETDPQKALEVARDLATDGELNTLGSVAEELAARDPDLALEAARLSVRHNGARMGALPSIAGAVARAAPRKALGLARGIEDEHTREWALSAVCGPLAVTDVVTAVGTARSLRDRKFRAEALCQIAAACAETDPEGSRAVGIEAEAAARSIDDASFRVDALGSAAAALLLTDPEKALELANDIRGRPLWFGETVNEALSKSDPDRLLEIAARAENESWRDSIVYRVALGLAKTDPEGALEVMEHTDDCDRLMVRNAVIAELAKRDPDRAIEMASSIEDEHDRGERLGIVAGGLARRDLEKALRLARSIDDPVRRVVALGSVAIALLRPSESTPQARRTGEQRPLGTEVTNGTGAEVSFGDRLGWEPGGTCPGDGDAEALSDVRDMPLAWVYDGGPAPGFDLRSLDVLPGGLLLGDGEVRGDIWLLSAATGELLWEIDIGGRPLGLPTAVSGNGGQLYTIGYRGGCESPGDDSPRVWALDRASGRVVRELPLRNRQDPSGVVWRFEGEWLFVSDRHGLSMLTAVDLSAWRVAWEWHPPSPGLGAWLLDVAAGKRFVAALVLPRDEKTPCVYLLDGAAGRLTSSTVLATDHDLSDLPRTQSVLYLLDVHGRTIRATDLDTGEDRWTFSLSDDEQVHDLLAFGDANSGKLLIQTTAPEPRTGNIYVLDATGGHLWSATAESLGIDRDEWLGAEWRAPGGVFVCLTRNGTPQSIIGVSEDTGQVLWRRPVGALCPEFGDTARCGFVAGQYRGVVLLHLRQQASERLAFAALDPVTGEVRARAVDPERIAYGAATPVVSDGERLYVMDYGARRRLVALQVGD